MGPRILGEWRYNPESRRRVTSGLLRPRGRQFLPPQGWVKVWRWGLGTTRGPLLFTKPPVSFEKLGKPVKALTQERQNLHYAYGRSGLMGVSRVRGYQRWVTNITVGGERHYLGCFTTPEEARQAYLSAKARLHPFQTIAVKAA